MKNHDAPLKIVFQSREELCISTSQELQGMGLNVITIWEYEVKGILQSPNRLFDMIKLFNLDV